MLSNHITAMLETLECHSPNWIAEIREFILSLEIKNTDLQKTILDLSNTVSERGLEIDKLEKQNLDFFTSWNEAKDKLKKQSTSSAQAISGLQKIILDWNKE